MCVSRSSRAAAATRASHGPPRGQQGLPATAMAGTDSVGRITPGRISRRNRNTQRADTSPLRLLQYASWTRRCARRPRSIRAAPRGASRASNYNLTETQRLSDARRGSDERRERVLVLGLVAEDLALGAREAEARAEAVLATLAGLRDPVALANGAPDLTGARLCGVREVL